MLASGPAEARPSPVPLQPLPQYPSGSFFYQEWLTSIACLFPLTAWGFVWGSSHWTQCWAPETHILHLFHKRTPGERPCWDRQPPTGRGALPEVWARSMKEFSFLGVFACVLGCASKPLPTHLYANESSHMLGMFCPQILNTMYRRRAWLLQKQDLRGGQLLPAIVSL